MIVLNLNIKYKLNNRKILVIFLLFFFQFQLVFSQSNDSVKYELNEKIVKRTSPDIEKYLNDPDFLYDTEKAKKSVNLWDYIYEYISRFFRFISKGGKVSEYIFYALIFSVIFYVVLKLFGYDIKSLILRKKQIKLDEISVYEEDIEQMNIDLLISQSINNLQYRSAVRFLYLKLLKTLSHNEFIKWEKHKTNSEYAKELKGSFCYEIYKKLTLWYEYVWYGEFQTDKQHFEKYRTEFENAYISINEKKEY